VGVEEPPPQHEERPPGPRDELLGVRNRVIMGCVFFVFYVVTFGPRTGMVPGVISGLLGATVVFLLLKEADERRKRRRR
jgi:hypothetical protein